MSNKPPSVNIVKNKTNKKHGNLGKYVHNVRDYHKVVNRSSLIVFCPKRYCEYCFYDLYSYVHMCDPELTAFTLLTETSCSEEIINHHMGMTRV